MMVGQDCKRYIEKMSDKDEQVVMYRIAAKDLKKVETVSLHCTSDGAAFDNEKDAKDWSEFSDLKGMARVKKLMIGEAASYGSCPLRHFLRLPGGLIYTQWTESDDKTRKISSQPLFVGVPDEWFDRRSDER